jgi:glucose/mannose-6-phosphate isomerase
MEQFIQEGPRQLLEAVAAVKKLPQSSESPTDAMLLGMGGSALGGGLVEMLRLQQQAPWRWHVVRDYRLPYAPRPGTRVFALSYSGGTEEVLEALTQAHPSGGNYLAVSCGGQLRELAQQLNIPWLEVPPKPSDFQPRFALYFMFGILHEVLVRDRLLEPGCDLTVLAKTLLASDLSPRGKRIADFVGERIPVIYTDTVYAAGVARTWRIKFNENSKIPAISGALPEINHNELIAFAPEFADRFAFLLMPDSDGPPKIAHRFQLFGRLMEQYGYPVMTVPLEGASGVEKALTSLQLADWVSFHVARGRGVDAVSIPAIQDFKRLL